MQEYISRLQSFLLWRDLVEKNPEKFGKYKFSQPIQVYEREVGPGCPFCQNLQSVNFRGTVYFCICSTLRWLQQSHYDLHEYETPVRSASLDTLHPLGISPEGDKDLQFLLGDVRRWIVRPKGWMLIQGGNGSAKSHVLAAIKTSLDGLAAFVSVDRLQQKLFDALKDEGKVQELIQNLSTIPVLLLDDWGIEHETSWITDTLASIINRRYMYAEEFPTVVTTNTPMKDLLSTPNPARRRIVSRLIDSEKSTVYQLRNPDYRSPIVQEQRRRSGHGTKKS